MLKGIEMGQVSSIVLGAVLALCTSVCAEWYKIFLHSRRTKKLLKGLLKIEIPTIVSVIDRLVEDSDKFGFIPLLVTSEIDTARQGYDRNRGWTILFRDDAFRRDLISFYQQLVTVCRDATSLESIAPQPQYAEFIKTKRPQIVAKFRDLAVRGREILHG